TRFSRDWSSDVCSSDLEPRFPGAEPRWVTIGGAEYTLTMWTDEAGPLLNGLEDVLVVSDARFEQWVESHADASFRTVVAWTGEEIGRATCRERGSLCVV